MGKAGKWNPHKKIQVPPENTCLHILECAFNQGELDPVATAPLAKIVTMNSNPVEHPYVPGIVGSSE